MRRHSIAFWACRRFNIYLPFMVRDAVALCAISFLFRSSQKRMPLPSLTQAHNCHC